MATRTSIVEIAGMHCASCGILVDDALGAVIEAGHTGTILATAVAS